MINSNAPSFLFSSGILQLCAFALHLFFLQINFGGEGAEPFKLSIPDGYRALAESIAPTVVEATELTAGGGGAAAVAAGGAVAAAAAFVGSSSESDAQHGWLV